MYKSVLAALALTSVAFAQTTTDLFLVGFDTQSIVGSIVTSDATATTYSLVCGDPNNCGLPDTGLLFVQGPSTMHYSYTADDTGVTESIDIGCTITSSLTGTCSGSVVAVVAGSSTTTSASTTTFTDSGSALGGQDVTLTAGALPALPTPSAAASTTSTGSTESTSSMQTKSSSSGKTTSTSSSPTGSSSSSSSSKAAAPLITQAPWLIGGAAAAMAYAAM